MRYLIRLVVAAILTAYASWALAADLVGTVRDRQGRPRPGVVVTFNSAEDTQKISRRTRATGTGEFVFSSVPPGAYELRCDGNKEPVKAQVRAGINRMDCR
jgi:protocatechuate 3,4-dioxygenase beta subunit